jgi:hypothetical protein
MSIAKEENIGKKAGTLGEELAAENIPFPYG